MIRINLLPVKAAQKKEKYKSQLTIAVATLLVTVALCSLAYLQLINWVQDAKADVEGKKLEISRLMKTIGEVNQYKKRQEALRAKLDILEKLEKARRGPVLQLDELYKSMPEKIWLESYKETGGRVILSGISINEELVALFMRNLETSSQFTNVSLKGIQQITRDGVKFHKFEIDCSLENQPQLNLDIDSAKNAKGKAKAPSQGT